MLLRYLMKTLTCVLLLEYVVLVESTAPVIDGLPTEINVGELETGSRLLYIYTIQDPDGDSFTCSNAITASKDGAAVAGTYNHFSATRNVNTGNYELKTTGLSTFDFATVDTYTNSITCTDSNTETSLTLDVIVNVIDNERVTINNVEGAANALTLDALTTGQGDTVKTVDSSSLLGNDIRYSIVSDPSFNPEFFTIDNGTGNIRTNRALQYLDSSNPTVYLTITAYDTVNNIKVYSTQTVNLNNQNTIPSTTNMITTLQESKIETLSAGTILFQVSTQDPDASQSHTYRYTCAPEAGEDTFTLDSNGNFMIATGMTLDYESIPFFTCEFYIDDGIHEGGPFTYELTVEDDNEAPSFSNSIYYVSTSEAAKGAVTFDPGFDCVDVDTGDSITYDFQSLNNSDRFTIGSDGLMSFNTNYDVDNSNMPTLVYLTVYCIDSGHLDGVSKTGTTQVAITIADVNDNEPTFPFSSYTVIVTETASPGSAIGVVVPSDEDSGVNADFRCSGSSSSSYGAYYAIGADCNVYLTKQIDFSSGVQTQFVLHATDDGTPQLTGTTTVDIIYQQTPTTTTTTAATTTEYNFFDHSGNVVLFVFTLLMGLALLGLLTFLLLKVCCGNMCYDTCRECRGFGNRRIRRYPPSQQEIDSENKPKHYNRPYEPDENPKPKPSTPIRTVANKNPGYGLWRPTPMRPMSYPMSRTAPSFLPGYV